MTVLNVRNVGKYREGAVYVGRPSKWGNPFPMKRESDRDKVIDQYTEWLLSNEDLMRSLPELKGKDLICYCAPKRCHADVLDLLVNG